MRSSAPIPRYDVTVRHPASRLPCDCVTPFGRPVEPEVKTIDAGSVGSAPIQRDVAGDRGTSAAYSIGTDAGSAGHSRSGARRISTGSTMSTAWAT